MRRLYPAALLLLLLAAGCGTTEPASGPSPSEPPAEEETETGDEEEVERGDEAEPLPTPEPEPRTVSGYRIQLVTTSDKDEADALYEEARSWWRQEGATQRSPMTQQGELAADIVWRQPYYRVQVGAFTSREEASEWLTSVEERFPDAFIVPAPVTIYP